MRAPILLVVEDDAIIARHLQFVLRKLGYQVDCIVRSGADAIQKAAELLPDLILMDVRMPKMTGYEACKALKENAVTANIPIVFLSAKGQEAEVQTGFEAGAVEYILKPFSPDQLTERVQAILRKYHR